MFLQLVYYESDSEEQCVIDLNYYLTSWQKVNYNYFDN